MYIEPIAMALFLLTMPSSSDEELVVHVVQRENTVYRTVIRSVNESAFDFQGNEEVLAEIRSRGVRFPMRMNLEQTIVLVIETGSKKPTGEIPFSGRLDSSVAIRYLNGLLQSSTEISPLDTSIRMWGTYTGGTMNIDSITVRKFDPSLADSLMKSMGHMMQSIPFPDSSLRVGESFSKKVPKPLAIQGIPDANIVGTITYTLLQFDTRLAFFDISQQFELLTPEDSVNLTISGNGNGQMIYDRSVSQLTQWKTRSSIKTKAILSNVNPPNIQVFTNTDIEYEFSVTVSDRK
jgi:hypothetical protein